MPADIRGAQYRRPVKYLPIADEPTGRSFAIQLRSGRLIVDFDERQPGTRYVRRGWPADSMAAALPWGDRLAPARRPLRDIRRAGSVHRARQRSTSVHRPSTPVHRRSTGAPERIKGPRGVRPIYKIRYSAYPRAGDGRGSVGPTSEGDDPGALITSAPTRRRRVRIATVAAARRFRRRRAGTVASSGVRPW